MSFNKVPCSRSSRRAWVLVAVAALLVVGCSSMSDDGPTVAYHDAESGKSLKVPPDLTRPQSSGALEVSESNNGESNSTGPARGSSATQDGVARADTGRSNQGSSGRLLPQFKNVHFKRVGNSTWLEIDNADPEKVWPRVGGFLNSQGLSVARRQPELGIVETNWTQRQDGPKRGGIGGLLTSFIGNLESSGIKDRYQIRLERMDEQGTRVFISQRSAKLVDASKSPKTSADLQYAESDGDPALEAEMARRMLVYLGLTDEDADQVVNRGGNALGGIVRYIVDSGKARVMVADPNKRRVFARVRNALVSIDADIESSDRKAGVYQFRWQPSSDSGKTQESQLRLAAVEDAVRIKAATARGDLRSGKDERALLRRLAIAMGADRDDVRNAAAEDEKNQSEDDWLNDRPTF